MRFKDKFVRTVENALHWKSSPPHDSYVDRQNSPPDERDAEFAEANEAADGVEHVLVSSSGASLKKTQSHS
jgi:hypothetical protein